MMRWHRHATGNTMQILLALFLLLVLGVLARTSSAGEKKADRACFEREKSPSSIFPSQTLVVRQEFRCSFFNEIEPRDFVEEYRPDLLFSSSARGLAGGDPNLVVMTFNIRYGNADDKGDGWPNRREMVFDVLRRHDPDVVGLQEALRFQIDEIRAALPQYAEIGVGREDGKTEGEYSAILYRKDHLALDDSGTFWLSDTPEVPGSITWGNACTRVCTWGRFVCKDSGTRGPAALGWGRNTPEGGGATGSPAAPGWGKTTPEGGGATDERPATSDEPGDSAEGPAFYLFNTHLDHKSQPAREYGAILLSRRIVERRHADPVILTGDFNADENNPAIRYLKGQSELATPDGAMSKNPVPLVDSFRVAHPTEQEVGTFHGFKGGAGGGKIDYILVQPNTTVLQTQILRDNKDGRYPSDHFPVLAVLRFAAEARP
ncbi:MAG: endonuclease/exonuclease/phosphatase family protein [Phycisphaerae bacterium]|nr:endonuclease/exonuclease/phosphatase family protein [Phycisphaerae bacterium]